MLFHQILYTYVCVCVSIYIFMYMKKGWSTLQGKVISYNSFMKTVQYNSSHNFINLQPDIVIDLTNVN